jgi:hypothetical protein
MQEYKGWALGDKLENYEYLWEKGQAEIIDIYEETTGSCYEKDIKPNYVWDEAHAIHNTSVWYAMVWRPYTKAGKVSKRGIREFRVAA